MDDLLKGNFKVKNPVKIEDTEDNRPAHEKIQDELKKRALNSLGGSMVYVERKKLVWDGESEDDGSSK